MLKLMVSIVASLFNKKPYRGMYFESFEFCLLPSRLRTTLSSDEFHMCAIEQDFVLDS